MNVPNLVDFMCTSITYQFETLESSKVDVKTLFTKCDYIYCHKPKVKSDYLS